MDDGLSDLMSNASPQSWYRRIGNPLPSTESVVWFPHAGGGVSSLIRQLNRSPPGINVFAATLPGRERRFNETMPDTLDQLIATLVAELPQLPRPPVLIGHSFGALLAYCVAQSAAASGLVVMAMSPPELISRRDSIVHLEDAEFVQQLDRRYGGIPQTLRENEEAMRLFLPPVRHDLSLMESYQDDAAKIVDIPVRAYAGSRDTRVSAERMEGWRGRTTATFSLETLSGDHFFPLLHVNRVLQSARRCFDTTH
ncbi:Linear gramicidin dehydrogenase LgrE [Allorhodopirellula solitaria]|uniref:Linear gramicidin dehydrogenase LgrE n=2 Tax=Allorhodopirellula solitaria TaxID=2527987 RepID=A0A5C5XU32_9BACT|nr:Linear gramicidin dehydrogenase LgrE [Allorhodopirellula solitaria]